MKRKFNLIDMVEAFVAGFFANMIIYYLIVRTWWR